MNYGEGRSGPMRLEGNRGPRPTSGAPRKPIAKGHDAVLKSIQDDGREITITMQSGEKINGTVVARDKFTISVRVANALGGYLVWVVYKHAMESFYAEAKAAVTE
jgi:sRNA-binding regulator protein Hfq